MEIKDSGDRTQYSTGAVRDCKEGKGRCDLMPLGVLYSFFNDVIFKDIEDFRASGSTMDLLIAICHFGESMKWNPYEMFIEASKHFEAGAKKYGENNWQKGIPVHSYIDSAVRHYLKYRAGWNDEPHDRAFIWNLMCGIWTAENHPELNDFSEVSK